MTWQADGEQEDGAHLAFHTPRLYHVERAWNGGGETLADSQYLRSPLMLTHYMEGAQSMMSVANGGVGMQVPGWART